MEKTNLELKIEKDQKIMRLLKVSEIRYHIGTTNLGPIDIMIRFGEDKYSFLLDSNPVDDEKNTILLKMYNLNV